MLASSLQQAVHQGVQVLLHVTHTFAILFGSTQVVPEKTAFQPTQ